MEEKTTELSFAEFYKRLKQALSNFYKRISVFFKRLWKVLFDKSVPITRQLAEIEIKRGIQRRLYFRKKRSQAKRKARRKWG
ncbi:hypothetical protein EMERY_93 [Brevibacillus phage Emery]|nr:hypothetical protein EMERY_93 [Brevibacillus phage Emery]